MRTPRRRGRPPKRIAPVPRAPRGKRATLTFDACVEASERVLVQVGPDGLTTNRVAEVAGVSVGSLYQYFPNKEAILAALFERYLVRFEQLFDEAVRGATSLDDAIMRITFLLIGDYQRHDPQIFQHLWRIRDIANAHDRISRSLQHMVDGTEQLFLRLGLADPEEARARAFVAIHAADGLANAFTNHPGAIDPARLGMLYTRMVQAMLAR